MFIKVPANTTRTFGAPEGWDQSKGECLGLPIADVETQHGNFMVSNWKPTAEEIAAIVANGSIELWIGGTSHPVVMLSVEGVR